VFHFLARIARITRLVVIDIQVLEFLSLAVFGNSINFSLDLHAFSEIYPVK